MSTPTARVSPNFSVKWGIMMTKKVLIEGMNCQHCANRVKNALNALEGVAVIDVDLDKKTATIEVPPFLDEVKIKEAVSEAGYEVMRIE